ncbi:MAG: hypothetical protein PHH11_12920, partial [Methylomonas sp.]|nr:hypothetical protein [Methylomonas sp.]
NASEAHGVLTVDDALFSASAADYTWLFPGEAIVDFTMTVSGAASGNGLFQLSDFDYFVWLTRTDTGSLDLTEELVGQATLGGPWGSDFSSEATTGDFNIWASENSGAPTIAGSLLIGTNEGAGDGLRLVSFRPVPVPTSFWLFGSAMVGMTRLIRRRPVAVA